MSTKRINVTTILPPSALFIGFVAENGVTNVEFDVSAWVAMYGSGTATLIMKRWGDAHPYPIALEVDNEGLATWTISATDTAKTGFAYAQLRYEAGEKVKKSPIYTLKIGESLGSPAEAPDQYEDWIDALTHLAAQAMAEALDLEDIPTDKTLTIDGAVADAKAAGDALALKADKSTTYTKTEVDQMIDDVEVETDTTLAIAGAPADAKKVGDELSDIKADLDAQAADIKTVSRSTYASPVTYTYLTDTTKWNVQAGMYPDTGGNQVSTKQCRSAFNTIKGNTLFWLASNVYTWVVWEYSSASASNATFSPHAEFDDKPALITKEQSSTHFRVSVKRKDGAAVSDSDATAIAAAVRTYMLTDTGMTVSGAAADAKTVGDLLTAQTGRLNALDAFADNITPVVKAGNDKTTDATMWEFGTFYTAGGSRADSNNKLRLKDDITHLREVKSTSAYLFGLFAWDSTGTYIGTLQEDGTYEKASPYYADDIVLDPTNGYTYNVLLKKADGTAISNASEAANVDIVTSLPMDNKAKIAKINQDVNSLQYLVRRPFPVDGKETNALAFYTSFEALADWIEISNSEVYEFGKKSGGYVDSHIDGYTNYPLKAYYYSGRKEYLGAFSSGSNGYQIGSPYTNDSHADASAASQYQRKKVLITAGMHGDEGATPNVLREYVRNLINNPDYADIVAAYDFCFIPLCNPYGYVIDRRNVRYWDGNEITNLDMNDDFPQDSTEQITNEAKFVKNTFLAYEPDIVIDLHQHNFDTNAESVTYRLAFGGISCLQTSGIDKSKYNALITGGAISAERKVKSMYNIENPSQTMFCWDRDTNTTTTFREYAIGTRDNTERHKATLSAISETSTRCYLYTESTDKYNQLANTVCQAFNDRFISGILREFAKS